MPPSYRHSFLIVFAAALVAGSLGGTRAAWAEMVSITQPPAFEQDLAELLPGAQAKLKPLADKARNSGECPDQIKINVTVMRGGDPLFLETMAGARWDAIWNFFNDPNLGLRPGQLPPKSPPRGKFPPGLFDIDGAYDEVQVSRESGDNDDPTIEVKWSRGGNPIESGTKVKPGDKIKVEITALDRGKAETKACQTGIAKFEVRANGEVFDHRVFLKSECEKGYCSEGGRRRDWYTTIEVEKKHAPILWLEVTAEDHANNTSKVTIGQFPFTNWHGRIEVDTKSFPLHPTTGEATYRLRAYLALDYDDKGNMTGSVVGSATNEARAHDPPGLPRDDFITTTVKPAKLKAKLVGEYTKGRRLSIKIDEDQSTPLELRSTRRYERRDGTTERETTSTGADSVNMFEEALRSQLKPTADGGFEWSPPDIDHGRGGYTRMRIWLRPAKD